MRKDTQKATVYGMGQGLLIGLLLGYLFEDLALGLVFGLGIGGALVYEKKNSKHKTRSAEKDGDRPL